MNTNSAEVSLEFRSFQEWMGWLRDNGWALDGKYIKNIAAEIMRCGLVDPLFGYIAPDKIDDSSTNYREGLIDEKMNSRLRAVCMTLVAEMLVNGPDLRIYASEWVSPFAAVIRNFLVYQGSEYLPTPVDKLRYPEIRHEDVTALSFANETFDIYVTNEVLEHVPNIDAALREANRILVPGGLFLGTFPMAYGSERTVRKAELRDGQIVHLTEPEYHGNPIDPSDGCLVFNIPAWDILSQAREAGFPDPQIKFISSRRHGILGAEIAGILLFVARKSGVPASL